METDSDAYSLYQRARLAIGNGRADEAIAPLERASAMEPDSTSILEALGTAYIKVGFYERAEDVFEKILERDPVDAFAHYCLARASDRLNDLEKARQHYRLAASLEPERRIYRESFRAFVARAFPERNKTSEDDDPQVMIFGD